MSDELKELEKNFILDEDAQKESIKELIRETLTFCKIDKGGYVVLENPSRKFTIVNKIMLVLSARYLANRLQASLGNEPSIKESVNVQELSDVLKVKQAVIRARLKDLKDKKNVVPTSSGTYRVAAYAIGPFLKSVGGKNES